MTKAVFAAPAFAAPVRVRRAIFAAIRFRHASFFRARRFPCTSFAPPVVSASAPGVSRSQAKKKGGPSAPPNIRTPKRSRATVNDEEFMKRHCKSCREVPSFLNKTEPSDYVAAIKTAAMWWPEYSGLGWDARGLLLRREVSPEITFAHPLDNQTITRTPTADPTPRALAASGAQVVDAPEFRM